MVFMSMRFPAYLMALQASRTSSAKNFELEITRSMKPAKPHFVARFPSKRVRTSRPVQIGEITGFSGVRSVDRGGKLCTLSENYVPTTFDPGGVAWKGTV